MQCGICFCDSWELTKLFTEQRGLSVPLFSSFLSAKRALFALSEIKTWCDLSLAGWISWVFIWFWCVNTDKDKPSSLKWMENRHGVLCTAVFMCHCPKMQVMKREAEEWGAYFCPQQWRHRVAFDRYVHTPELLWDIWYLNTLEHEGDPNCWLKDINLWGTGLENPGQMLQPWVIPCR